MKASRLSKAVIALVIASAPAGVLTNQFLIEKEGMRLYAYQDGSRGIWTICLGHTAGVKKGDVATPEQCAAWARQDIGKAVERVEKLTPVKLSEPQKASFASFCIYNLGERACSTNKDGTKTMFWQAWMRGDIKEACRQIPRWIHDNGKDCRVQANNCLGQVLRRDQEAELCLID